MTWKLRVRHYSDPSPKLIAICKQIIKTFFFYVYIIDIDTCLEGWRSIPYHGRSFNVG